MGREKLIVFAFAFFVFMLSPTSVEEPFSQDTSDFICTADKDIDKESRDMIDQARLIKLKVLHEVRVDCERANQTDLNNSRSNSSTFAQSPDGKPRKKLQSRLQFFSQTISEGIFSGQFPSGGYKETNVSCIFKDFKSTLSKELATNHSMRRLRLSFNTPQSTLFYVEHLANFTKSNGTFFTLLRTESNTRQTVGVYAGTNESLASTKSASDNELQIISDRWLFVAKIFWIALVLYSTVPLILHFLYILFSFFSPPWEIFFTVPLWVSTIGLMKVLVSHTYKALPHIAIAVNTVNYFWCYYSSLTRNLRSLAFKLIDGEHQQGNPGEDEAQMIPIVYILVLRLLSLLTFFLVVFAVVMETPDASDQARAKATATFLTVFIYIPKIIFLFLFDQRPK